MYSIGDEVKVKPDLVRWPAYPNGFTGQILRLEALPAFQGEVWAMVAVIVNDRAQEARLVPLPLDLEVLPRQERPMTGSGSDVRFGPPRGFKRFDPADPSRP